MSESQPDTERPSTTSCSRNSSFTKETGKMGRKRQCHTSSFLGPEWPDSMKPIWEVRLPCRRKFQRSVRTVFLHVTEDFLEVRTIGLLNHTGGGNLGDDATHEVVIHNTRSRWPSASISAISMNPADTNVRLGIGSYPIRQRTWTLGAACMNSTSNFRNSLSTSAKFDIINPDQGFQQKRPLRL